VNRPDKRPKPCQAIFRRDQEVCILHTAHGHGSRDARPPVPVFSLFWRASVSRAACPLSGKAIMRIADKAALIPRTAIRIMGPLGVGLRAPTFTASAMRRRRSPEVSGGPRPPGAGSYASAAHFCRPRPEVGGHLRTFTLCCNSGGSPLPAKMRIAGEVSRSVVPWP